MFMENQTETTPTVVQMLILMAGLMIKTTLRTNPASGWTRMETMETNSMDTKGTPALKITDYCSRIPGYNDTFGCPDADGDGWSDGGDDLPFEPTQWLDGDGDGYGNNQSEGANLVDLFPNDATQWNDTDGDGYGDNRYGSEGDKFPDDPLRWEDTDNDGITDYEDAFPTDITQWNDTDGDGFGDEITGNGGDACPETWGNSTADRRGCVDTDGDGWSDERDDFPFDPNLC